MRLKILIAEDDPVNIIPLEAAINRLGHRALIAKDGIEAVEKYLDDDPDLIFMDIMMPRMDGIEAARRIRALPGLRWVPIIFLSAPGGTDDVVRGLDAGGDDYLARPAPLQLIRAKISGIARILSIQRDVRSHLDELGAWREDAEAQSKLGQHVVSRLLDTAGLRDPMLRWMNLPAETFSGDLVCAARGPGDVLYAMLADAAGHGLSAALTALPMTQIFYGMAGKGFSIHTIAGELNAKLKSFLPIERFVAACLVAVDVRNQTIGIWNGGNPDVLLIADDGAVSMRWPSRHPPLGILTHGQFDDTTETINYRHDGELVLYSDGIIETEGADGRRLNMEGLEAILASADRGHRLAALEEGVMRHLAGRRQHDDLSGIAIRIPLERRRRIRTPAPGIADPEKKRQSSEWRLELGWGASELRHLDVVPAVLGFLNQIHALKPHKGQLFLILSELFNNALDHGVLGLESSLKQSEGGFGRYLEERERRLGNLTDGRIEISFHLTQTTAGPTLEVCMEDSGNGFDYGNLDRLLDEQVNLQGYSGRGIRLVKSLCQQVTYSGCGNRVSARYAL